MDYHIVDLSSVFAKFCVSCWHHKRIWTKLLLHKISSLRHANSGTGSNMTKMSLFWSQDKL